MTTDEEIVVQIEDLDFEEEAATDAVTAPNRRARTHNDWPPAPPLPADVDLAEGTMPPQRNAAIYAAVRRPTTSS